MFRVDAAEFVMLLPATLQNEARSVVDSVVQALQPEFQHIAIGVAGYPHPQISHASHLYRAANVSLAQTRSGGSAQLVTYFERF